MHDRAARGRPRAAVPAADRQRRARPRDGPRRQEQDGPREADAGRQEVVLPVHDEGRGDQLVDDLHQ